MTHNDKMDTFTPTGMGAVANRSSIAEPLAGGRTRGEPELEDDEWYQTIAYNPDEERWEMSKWERNKKSYNDKRRSTSIFDTKSEAIDFVKPSSDEQSIATTLVYKKNGEFQKLIQ